MIRLLYLVLFTLLFSGCSTLKPTAPTPVPPAKSWQSHLQQVQQLQRWNINGKIGIRNSQDAQSATLNWLQEEQQYQIDIRGPWGQGGASINGNEDKVTLLTGGERYQADNAEQLLAEQLGWVLPVSDIYWWIRGIPAPDSSFQQTLQDNRLQQLTQKGWQIEYLRYSHLSPQLPEKIRMTYNGLKITLIIKQWQIL